MATWTVGEAELQDQATRVSVDEFATHLPHLESELLDGKYIELVRGSDIVAEVRAPGTFGSGMKASEFDFAAQRKRMWGDRVFTGDTTQWIREDRDSE